MTNQKKNLSTQRLKTILAAISLLGPTIGFTAAQSLNNQVQAQGISPVTATPSKTGVNHPATNLLPPPPVTPTPWATPAPWSPAHRPIPTLAPVPVVSVNQIRTANGLISVGYAPPDGADVFGSALLRWEYPRELAPDEFFDIKIKPLGSENSVFVDWSKTEEYRLSPWNGWQPGLYTWQIGIIKGTLNGNTKHFITDTGQDSQPMLLKWQAGGNGGSNGGPTDGGNIPAPGGGGGGGNSGGS